MKTSVLPDKPSDLLELALADLALAEAHPKYRINMGIFLAKIRGEDGSPVCCVCLAGAVMANRFCRDAISDPEFFDAIATGDTGEQNKLYALNWFRTGNCVSAFLNLSIDSLIGERFHREVDPYHENPKLWREQMNQLVKDLRDEGY